jgi:integrase
MKRVQRARHGTGCVYKRKKKDGSFSWWFKFHVDGRSVFRNANTTDKEEAKRQLALNLGEKAKGIPIASHALTFEEATKNVKLARGSNYVFDLHLLPYFGKATKMAAITTPTIREYIKHREAAGMANATINRELEALSAAFTLALQDGVLFARPHIPTLKENNTRTGFFEPAQLTRLLKHLNEPLQHVVTFGYLTGWRLGEVLNLQWRNVDLEAGEIRLDAGSTKNGEGRVIPIEDTELRKVLDRRWELHKARMKKENVLTFSKKSDVHVFVRKGGKPIGSFYKRWWHACRAAGIPDRVEKRELPDGQMITKRHPGRIFHDLRRTAVRNLTNAGVPAKVAMVITGHKTRSVFDRYTIVPLEDQRLAMRKQEAARNRSIQAV